ncbi:molecular chaperone [Niveibacterium sp. SC-1]|uniref:fimbrial biogenesis chaperone n=1 Tax=Niveibacterium sp. SC-1 TaxID=3135646 RepID=UPI00311E5CBD
MLGATAHAGGLQVLPTTLSLAPDKNAGALWLSNTGDTPLNAQVRVYRWTQEGEANQVTPSSELQASPPMLQIPPGGKQLVRVVRLRQPPSGAVEEAYRLIINELPPARKEGQQGLSYVLRYSVPVFLQPSAPARPPQLNWALERGSGAAVSLKVSNSGAQRAQLASLDFVDRAGKRTELMPGLIGYVLPGATMRWALKASEQVFATGGTLEVMVNGEKLSAENLSLSATSR